MSESLAFAGASSTIRRLWQRRSRPRIHCHLKSIPPTHAHKKVIGIVREADAGAPVEHKVVRHLVIDADVEHRDHELVFKFIGEDAVALGVRSADSTSGQASSQPSNNQPPLH